MFGIQTAIQGGSVPLLANSSKKRMKEDIREAEGNADADVESRAAPHLALRGETPMSVRMNVPTG